MSSSFEVSASELSYMKAQVWTLEKHLRHEKQNIENLTVSQANSTHDAKVACNEMGTFESHVMKFDGERN